VRDDMALLLAIDARAKSDHLSQIEAVIEAPVPADLAASIIVCTHRFDATLLRVVRAALAQQCRGNRFEVLVVDNAAPPAGAASATREQLQQLSAATPDRLRLIVCPIPGLSAARNAGIAEARGEIAAFLDDDAVPSAEWLSRLVDAFDAHPGTAVIGGHIVLEVPAPRPDAAVPGWEKYWSQFVTPHTTFTPVQHWWEFPWGANWAARRDALRRVGGFRLHYGRTGNDYWGGEELVAAALIQRLGGGVAILPQATVTHAVDPSRFSFEHVRHTVRAGHLASYQAQRDLHIPRETSLVRTLAQLAARHVDRGLPPAHRRLDFRYRKRAQLALLLQQLRDLRARRRAPIVAE
jgi:GT2 family glycosyltransferase